MSPHLGWHGVTFLGVCYGHAAATRRLTPYHSYVSAALDHPIPSVVCAIVALVAARDLFMHEQRRQPSTHRMLRRSLAAATLTLVSATALCRTSWNYGVHNLVADASVYLLAAYLIMLVVTTPRASLPVPPVARPSRRILGHALEMGGFRPRVRRHPCPRSGTWRHRFRYHLQSSP